MGRPTYSLTMESGKKEYLDESRTHGLSTIQIPITRHYNHLLVHAVKPQTKYHSDTYQYIPLPLRAQ
jgi:hypothetical protein